MHTTEYNSAEGETVTCSNMNCKVLCYMREANHKRVYTVWHHVYDTLEKIKLYCQETDLWLPGLEEGDGLKRDTGKIYGMILWLCWWWHDCQNSRTVHFCKLHINYISIHLIKINLPQ